MVSSKEQFLRYCQDRRSNVGLEDEKTFLVMWSEYRSSASNKNPPPIFRTAGLEEAE